MWVGGFVTAVVAGLVAVAGLGPGTTVVAAGGVSALLLAIVVASWVRRLVGPERDHTERDRADVGTIQGGTMLSGAVLTRTGKTVGINVVVLNGGSSSGKTSIARCLQELLPGPWLSLSIDDLVAALPTGEHGERGLIAFAPDGGVGIGPGFRIVEAAWSAGLAAMAGAGAGVIYDDVFLEGQASQARLRLALEGLEVLWIGVRCDPAVAAAREVARADRVPGMAASQAEIVHVGVD